MASGQPICDDKKDPIKVDSEGSPVDSSLDGLEGESGELGEGEGEGEGGQADPTPEQAPKRKGGRKPIYATTEERKQRNRQAQAAFRERRTEYIKQLEQTISVQEHTLNNLNAAHRTAMDECLMLRYKNSLLERILLEKGINVQAELQAKHGSPNFGPTHMPAMIPPTPISRTLMNRHNSRRSTSSIAPKVETGFNLPPIQSGHLPAASPKSRASAASPPTTDGNSPGIMRPGMPPNPGKQPGHPMSQMTNASRMMPPMQPSMGQPQQQGLEARIGGGAGTANAAPFYQTPQYQSHLEQLEQEYDAAADMMDEQQQGPNDGEVGGPGPYPGSAYAHAAAQQQQQQQHQQQLSPTSVTASEGPGQPHQQQPGLSMSGMMGTGMDWEDPFGLTASMAFPSSYGSFDTSSLR